MYDAAQPLVVYWVCAFEYSTSKYNTGIACAMLQGASFGNETLWQPTLALQAAEYVREGISTYLS